MYRLFIFSFILLASGCALTPQKTVLPPNFKLGGFDASSLSAEWWQWAMSSPDEINPVRDNSGAHCEVGQQGNIWFLAGGFGSSKIKRSCVIPYGKSIFFPIINMVYYPREENNGYTCEQAKASAAVNNDKALDLYVELDGVAVINPKRYRASSEKCFDIFERIPKEYKPYNAYPSASDGYWIGLMPLQKGKHTLKFGGRYSSTGTTYGRTVQDIEYEITVQ